MRRSTQVTLLFATLVGMLLPSTLALVPPPPPPQREPDFDRRADEVTSASSPAATGTDQRAVYGGTTYFPDEAYAELTSAVAASSGTTALAEFTKNNQPEAGLSTVSSNAEPPAETSEPEEK